MSLHRLPLFAALTLALAITFGCNSNVDTYTETIEYSSVEVKAFSLKANDSVLARLDSVFFSIDLTNYQIFNADSLPKGTDVSRLVVTISTPTVSRCELIVNRKEGGDTTINYLTSQKDSIDFSNGPVTLRVTSKDGTLTRDYKIHVNVHQMEPDSLLWDKTLMRAVPSSLKEIAASKAVRIGDYAVCLSANAANDAFCIATTEHPLGDWTLNSSPKLPANPVVSSLCNTEEALFILDGNNELYTSTDLGNTWTDTGVQMHNLLGGYNGNVLGMCGDISSLSGEDRYILAWPSGVTISIPDDFPVSGYSTMLEYSSTWSISPMCIFIGGRLADGSLSYDTWAYDGEKWACINGERSFLMPGENYALVPYYAFRTTISWSVTKETIMLAYAGTDEDGEGIRDVYISFDRGINWAPAGDLMQLPEYIPTLRNAQVLCFSTEMAINPDKSWTEMPSAKLPFWLKVADSKTPSRVSEPVTEWECPSLYIFGGIDPDGKYSNTVWHGVINRLTFKPLY